MNPEVILAKLKKFAPLIIAVIIVLIILFSLIGGYNSLVDLEVSVDSKASTIEIRLQERYDLMTQLLNAIAGIQDHEEDIYNAITSARTAYNAAVASGSTEDLIAADAAETAAIINALAVVEDNYPNIAASEAYMAYMNDAAAMESALAYARREYNTAVENYNAEVRKFPKVMYAGMFGFEKSKPFWKMAEGAEEIPLVDLTD